MRRGYASLVSIFLLGAVLIGLFALVFFLRDRVGFASRASELIPSLTPEQSEASTIHNPRVLFITLNPTEGGRNIAAEYFSDWWGGRTLSEAEEETKAVNINYFKTLSEGRVNFTIVKSLSITKSPPYTNGYLFTVDDYKKCINGGKLSNGLTCEEQKGLFNHQAFLKQNNICRIAANNKVDQIWLLSSPYLSVWEYWMVGPTKSELPADGAFADKNCLKQILVMSQSYQGLSPMGHVFGHWIEAGIQHLATYWRAKDDKKYIENFLNTERYAHFGTVPPYPGPGCGNAHFPLNALADYDYENHTVRDFNCRDWNNIPNFVGTTEAINCEAWHCNDADWNAYWQKSLPHSAGTMSVSLIDGRKVNIKRDWWYYILSPDAIFKFVKNSKPQGALVEMASPQTILPLETTGIDSVTPSPSLSN